MSSVAYLCPQNVPKSLTYWESFSAPSDPLAGFKRANLRSLLLRGKERGKGGARGRQNDLCPKAPETFVVRLLDISSVELDVC